MVKNAPGFSEHNKNERRRICRIPAFTHLILGHQGTVCLQNVLGTENDNPITLQFDMNVSNV